MIKKLVFFISSVLVLSFASADDAAENSYKDLVIADVHRHVQRWISPSKLLKEMDELNIGWAGGVGAPYGPWDIKPYVELLGKRYIATAGQVTITDIYRRHGVKGIEDAETNYYKTLVAESNELFETGVIKGFGELILNNLNSHPNPSFTRKAKIDSSGITQLFDIANKWSGFVQIHAEDDANSVQELVNIANTYPSVPIILSHCLFTRNTALIDDLLSNHQNFYCEMSARNASLFSNQFARQKADDLGWIVFDDKNLSNDWKILIEKHPTRFMVGTDNYNSSVNTKKVVYQIRNGLLRNLSPDVAKLVASGNAIRVMRLE
jgi:hypothetical protein